MNASLLSDLEVARLQHPAEGDIALVRRLALDTVRELTLVAPVNPDLIASYRGIARIEEVDQPWAGCLTHDGGETVARVRASDNRPRKRFSALHEVKHTYLPGFAVTQYRCDPSPSSAGPESRSLEQLADIGASEFLFPRHEFRADLAGNHLTLDLVEGLATKYEASIGATALRCVALAETDALLICAEPGTKPSDPYAEPVLRITWSSRNGDWPYIPRFKSVPLHSPIHRSSQGELVDELGDLGEFTSPAIQNVLVSCRLYPFVDSHGESHFRVMCLATRQ